MGMEMEKKSSPLHARILRKDIPEEGAAQEAQHLQHFIGFALTELPPCPVSIVSGKSPHSARCLHVPCRLFCVKRPTLPDISMLRIGCFI